VIAHRGYWKTEGSAQNSIKAIELADEIKAYGSEFDVHLTSDNILIIFHDRNIDSIDIQQTPYDDLKNITIANGEKIPTLDQYLECAKTLKNTKLIFELKSHSTPERDREAAKYSVDMINEKGLTKQTEYITFSLEAAKELHRLSPETPVYYLNGDLSPKELKELGLTGLDYHYGVMRKNPHWFKEAKDLGLKINIWTVNDSDMMKEMIDAGADFITTDEPELLQQVICEHCK
jgi:glycerophosphoryl diester phosphodiesterase